MIHPPTSAADRGAPEPDAIDVRAPLGRRRRRRRPWIMWRQCAAVLRRLPSFASQSGGTARFCSSDGPASFPYQVVITFGPKIVRTARDLGDGHDYVDCFGVL